MKTLEGLKVNRERIEGVEIPAEQRAVRERLALQQRQAQRAEIAQARFGLGFSAWEIHDRIRCVVPFRPFRMRTTEWFAIDLHAILSDELREVVSVGREVRVSSVAEVYPRFIPDAALVKYQEAKASGLFEQCFVVEAGYYKRHQPAPDPWLVGQTNDRYIVLAYWD